MSKISDTDLAYIAGFFDGEGSITIHHNSKLSPRGRSPNHTLQIQLTNTNPIVLIFIHEHFGGSLIFRQVKNKKHRNIAHWGARARDGLRFLQAIRPFLRMKTIQADTAIAFQLNKPGWSGGPNNRVPEEVICKREEQRNIILAANRKRHIGDLGQKTYVKHNRVWPIRPPYKTEIWHGAVTDWNSNRGWLAKDSDK